VWDDAAGDFGQCFERFVLLGAFPFVYVAVFGSWYLVHLKRLQKRAERGLPSPRPRDQPATPRLLSVNDDEEEDDDDSDGAGEQQPFLNRVSSRSFAGSRQSSYVPASATVIGWLGLFLSTLAVVASLYSIVREAIQFLQGDYSEGYAGIGGVGLLCASWIFYSAIHFKTQLARKRSTSWMLFSFSMVITAGSIIRTRTIVLRLQEGQPVDDNSDVAELVSGCLAMCLFTLALVDACFVPPIPRLKRGSAIREPSLEPSAPFFSKLIFAWFDSLIWKGYKKTLSSEDVWDLCPEDVSEVSYARFSKICNQRAAKARQRNKPEPSLVSNLFVFSSVLLLKQAIWALLGVVSILGGECRIGDARI
jgi:hypothetical protein